MEIRYPKCNKKTEAGLIDAESKRSKYIPPYHCNEQDTSIVSLEKSFLERIIK